MKNIRSVANLQQIDTVGNTECLYCNKCSCLFISSQIGIKYLSTSWRTSWVSFGQNNLTNIYGSRSFFHNIGTSSTRLHPLQFFENKWCSFRKIYVLGLSREIAIEIFISHLSALKHISILISTKHWLLWDTLTPHFFMGEVH